MQISSSLPSLTPAQLSKADKVVAEFKQVEADVIAVDNDKIDLNSNEGEVKLDFTPLKPNAREKFTGEVTYNKDTKEAEKTFEGYRYGDFKKAVADAVLEELEPFQARYREILENKSYEEALRKGAEKARAIANKTLKRVQKAVGLLQE